MRRSLVIRVETLIIGHFFCTLNTDDINFKYIIKLKHLYRGCISI
jgi:hypothetical protein